MGQPLNRFGPFAIHEMTPFCASAAAMIIRQRMVMTAVLENPLIPSSGVTRPKSIKTPMIQKTILSIGNISKAKRTIIVAIIKNNRAISKSFWQKLFLNKAVCISKKIQPVKKTARLNNF